MRALLFFCALAAATLAAPSASALSNFPGRIPNGNKFLCSTCHTSSGGGEGWNAFGKDVLRQDPNVTDQDVAGSGSNAHYSLSGPTWDATLCGKDSDGDGQTNGQELGDPNCIWSTGQTPARVANISNPGSSSSTSSDPTGVTGGAGEGEGEAAEGEGETPPGGCASMIDSRADGTSTAGANGSGAGLWGLLALVGLFGRRTQKRG